MYLNKQKKEAITLVAAMIGTGEKWVNEKMMDGTRKELKTAITMLGKVLDHLQGDMDKDQLEGLVRFIRHNTMEFVPRPAAGMEKEPIYTVAASDMEYLMKQCSVECTLCNKTGEAVKRCELRRVMLRCGMLPNGTKECPFADGI